MRAGRSWSKVVNRLSPALFSVLVLSLFSELKRGAGVGGGVRAPHRLWSSLPANVPLTLRVPGDLGAVTVLGAARPAMGLLTPALGLATQRPVLIGGSRVSALRFLISSVGKKKKSGKPES